MVISANSGLKVAARLSPRIRSESNQVWKLFAHLLDSGKIDGCILADRGMRTSASFHTKDALSGSAPARVKISAPLRVDSLVIAQMS